MAHRPLYGHHDVRQRLASAALDGSLPSSLLLTGRRGIGKQRLALWMGQYLLCERAMTGGALEPCGDCKSCRYATTMVHPDLHWVFPQLRKDLETDRDADEVKDDLREAAAERMEADGLWKASDRTSALFLDTMKAVVKWATKRPAMSSVQVFVLGDAERMVSQSASPEAANTFLKLLEEPPAAVRLVLTSSEPGLLLPTIKSRVVTVRVPPVSREDCDAFLDDAAVARHWKGTRDEALAQMRGAPGALLSVDDLRATYASARTLLEAALQPATPDGVAIRTKVAAKQGVAGARGAFSDVLDALTELLHGRTRHLIEAGREVEARRTTLALPVVEQVRELTQRNVAPNLLTASLLRDLHRVLHP